MISTPQETSARINPLVPLTLATSIAALGTSIANVALPEISIRFAISISTTQWVTLSFLIATTITVVLMGRLADAFGKTRILTAGIIVFTISSLLSGLAPNLWILIVFRIIQGIGAAAMMVVPTSLIRETVPKEKTGQAMGTIGSSMAAGMALGPALGGLLISVFDWRATLLALVPLGVAAFVLMRLAFPNKVPPVVSRFSFDPLGLALMSIALGAYTVAITLHPGGVIGTAILAIVAVSSALAFIGTQLKTGSPLVDLRLIRSIKVIPNFIMAFLGALVMMSFMTVSPFYLTLGLNLPSSLMGLVLAAGPVVAILAGVPAGRLVDKHGAVVIAVSGLSLMTFAALLFAFVTPLLGVAGFLIAAVLLTPGNQMFMAANNSGTFARADAQQQGAISGLLNLARNLGTITGAGLAAMLFDAIYTETDPTPSAALGLQVVFYSAIIAGGCAIALASVEYVRARRPQ